MANNASTASDGTVRCWGDGTGGRLGYGTTTTIGDNETPASVGPVDLGEGGAAVAITAGGWHTCVILDNGSVRCWGLGNDGRLGYGTTANVGDDETPGAVGPVNLGAGRTAFAISAAGEGGGSGHTCAVLDDGNVRCWGAAAAGRLGYGNGNNIGDNEAPGSVGPVNLGAGRTAIKVNASGFHTCAILDNGTVKCWGSGSEGRLGYGNTATIGDDETPAAVGVVDLGAGRTATALAGWGNYTCALLNDDTLRCWGRAGNPSDGTLGYPNFVGDVGDNETPGSMGPVNVTTAGPSPKGQLRVTTTPALPTLISINGAVADSWSVDWLDLPPGQYTVSFGDIAGWTTPAPTVVTVNDGGLATVNGAFVQRGSLRVTTLAPVGAVISVDGVPRNEWGMWTDLPTGSHQVCFSPVVTLTTPPCQSVTVNAGALAAVVGRYNAHWYRADGNPNDSVGANNALWQGTAAYGTGDAGGADQAFSLNGTNHLTATVGAVGGGNFAAQIRFKTGQTGLTSLFEARPSCGSPAFWGMRLTAAGRVAAEFGPDDLLGSTALLNDDAWHTAKLQRSGTTLSLIVDGKVDATAVVTGPSVGVETARIGRSACVGADGTASFVGLIDDVRLGQPGDFTGPLPAFANGSFEQPTIASGSFQRVPPLTIPSWTVTGQTVDVVSAGFDIPPHHGVNHLDMNGAEPGTICQSFATTAGVPYQVGFWMSRAPALASGQLTASITGGPSLVAGHSGPVSVTNPNWQFHTFGFNAAGATSTLCLAANVPASGIQGSRVDNVTVGV